MWFNLNIIPSKTQSGVEGPNTGIIPTPIPAAKLSDNFWGEAPRLSWSFKGLIILSEINFFTFILRNWVLSRNDKNFQALQRDERAHESQNKF